MRAQDAFGAMDQGPTSADSPRQQCSILVDGLGNHAVAFKFVEVAREGKGDRWSSVRIRRVDDGVLPQFGKVGDPWIFNPPNLLRKGLWVRHQSRLRVDLPVADPIRGAGGAEMGESAPIFDATQKKRGAVGEQHRTRVENAIYEVRPFRG